MKYHKKLFWMTNGFSQTSILLQVSPSVDQHQLWCRRLPVQNFELDFENDQQNAEAFFFACSISVFLAGLLTPASVNFAWIDMVLMAEITSCICSKLEVDNHSLFIGLPFSEIRFD